MKMNNEHFTKQDLLEMLELEFENLESMEELICSIADNVDKTVTPDTLEWLWVIYDERFRKSRRVVLGTVNMLRQSIRMKSADQTAEIREIKST